MLFMIVEAQMQMGGTGLHFMLLLVVLVLILSCLSALLGLSNGFAKKDQSTCTSVELH